MAKIENEIQYKAAMERIDELLLLVSEDTPIEDKNSVELVLLSNLVADYDEEHYPISAPTIADILRYKMAENNIPQNDMAKTLGVSQSRVSDYLTGKAEPTLKIARIMCQKLDISPALIMGM